jgi:hypothetical protein
MGLFNKVSNIVKNNLGNLTGGGGIVNSIAGAYVGLHNIMDAAKNSAQTNAAAAKILNKSPLEIDDTSPTKHLKQNPYEYGTVYYPNDVSNLGTGHYMIFDVIMNNDTTFQNTSFNSNRIVPNKQAVVGEKIFDKVKKVSGLGGQFQTASEQGIKSRVTEIKDQGITSDRIRQVATGVNAARPTHSFVSDSIILYTPPQVKTTYNTNYEQAETGIAGQFGGLKSIQDFLNKGVGALGVLGQQAVGAVASLIPGFGDLNAFISKTTGTAINPNLEMVFKSVPFRDFSYTFDFAPRNRKETDAVNKIINLFKFHMQPELGVTNYFVTPSEFQITYMYLDGRNAYIPRVSRCVLKTMELDQSPEGVFTTFAGDEKGAMPVYSKINLTFTETEIMTKQTIAEGF